MNSPQPAADASAQVRQALRYAFTIGTPHNFALQTLMFLSYGVIFGVFGHEVMCSLAFYFAGFCASCGLLRYESTGSGNR